MKLIRPALVAAGLLAVAGAASARVDVSVGIGFPGAVVAAPAPVYYAPPPPPVVYYQPATYVRPAPVVYYDSYVYSPPVYVRSKVRRHHHHRHWRY